MTASLKTFSHLAVCIIDGPIADVDVADVDVAAYVAHADHGEVVEAATCATLWLTQLPHQAALDTPPNNLSLFSVCKLSNIFSRYSLLIIVLYRAIKAICMSTGRQVE